MTNEMKITFTLANYYCNRQFNVIRYIKIRSFFSQNSSGKIIIRWLSTKLNKQYHILLGKIKMNQTYHLVRFTFFVFSILKQSTRIQNQEVENLIENHVYHYNLNVGKLFVFGYDEKMSFAKLN